MAAKEEGVASLLKKPSLSESEKKGIKIGRSVVISEGLGDLKAVVKVISEKPAKVDALAVTLGRIWCPIWGVEVKELGENRFMFTFLRGSGKMKAMEDGPWMFGKELVVVAEFDGKKMIDEVEFNSIPIWIRIQKMPLGLMMKEAGEQIGEMVGEVLVVDADENGRAVGEFLRVKVKLEIRKSLMRGVMLDVGEGEEEKMKWCPLVYEFLPNFCYIYGLIGHIDRACLEYAQKKGSPQFSRSLRFIPERKKFGDESRGRPSLQHSMLPWKQGRGRGSGDSGSGGSLEKRGSGSSSWRKEESGGGSATLAPGEEKEVTSPLKVAKKLTGEGEVKKMLTFENPVTVKQNEQPLGKGDRSDDMSNKVGDAAKDRKQDGNGDSNPRGFKKAKAHPGRCRKEGSRGRCNSGQEEITGGRTYGD